MESCVKYGIWMAFLFMNGLGLWVLDKFLFLFLWEQVSSFHLLFAQNGNFALSNHSLYMMYEYI